MTANTALIEDRLAALDIALPAGAPPAANYVPYTRNGDLLFISGQLPLVGGKPAYRGRSVTIFPRSRATRRQKLAPSTSSRKSRRRACWGASKQIVRLGGFVSCTADFTDQPKVINGASDLMVAVFAEAGRHARAAVGVASLPFGVPVEIDAIVALTE